jgi:hypothetical protein
MNLRENIYRVQTMMGVINQPKKGLGINASHITTDLTKFPTVKIKLGTFNIE